MSAPEKESTGECYADSTPFCWSSQLNPQSLLRRSKLHLVPTRQLKSSEEVGKAQRFLWLVVSFMFISERIPKKNRRMIRFSLFGMAQPASLGNIR